MLKETILKMCQLYKPPAEEADSKIIPHCIVGVIKMNVLSWSRSISQDCKKKLFDLPFALQGNCCHPQVTPVVLGCRKK